MIIYKITNSVNDKVYIGQTTLKLSKRIHGYKNDVFYKKDGEVRPIIAAMRKYGFDKFHFEILEDSITTKEELDNRERYYIQLFQSLCTQNGYNISPGGNSVGKHAESTKKKIGESQKGELNHMFGKYGKENGHSMPIIEITTGLRFESACLAAKHFNLNFSHICASARGSRGSTGGYIFRYLDKDNQPIKPETTCVVKNIHTRNSVLPEYLYLL